MAAYTPYTLAQRPELKPTLDRFADHWQDFMNNDVIANQHFGRLYEWFADYQIAVCDAADRVVARVLSMPVIWNGDDATLDDAGWNWGFINAVTTYEQGQTPNTLCAVEINILPEMRGQGLSSIALQIMKANAQRHNMTHFIAPVRPNLKEQYPLTPMTHYIKWTYTDGEAPFDAWLRVHWRAGARIARVAPRSMRVVGTVAEWENWAAMRFPETGDYVVPGALCPVHIDREADEGVYIEPNVWMVHPLS